MRGLGLAALAVLALATRAEAQCISIGFSCYCRDTTRVALVTTEFVDGIIATVHVDSAERGLDAGTTLRFPQQSSEAVGSRWLLLGTERRPIDAQENVTCPPESLEPIPLQTVINAAASNTCIEDLEAAGLKQPPCNDTARCSVGPLVLLPLLAGLWLLRRRTS